MARAGTPSAESSVAPAREARWGPRTLSSPTPAASASRPVVCAPHTRASSASAQRATRAACAASEAVRCAKRTLRGARPNAATSDASAASACPPPLPPAAAGAEAPVAMTNCARARATPDAHTCISVGSSLLSRLKLHAAAAAASSPAASPSAASPAVSARRRRCRGCRRRASSSAGVLAQRSSIWPLTRCECGSHTGASTQVRASRGSSTWRWSRARAGLGARLRVRDTAFGQEFGFGLRVGARAVGSGLGSRVSGLSLFGGSSSAPFGRRRRSGQRGQPSSRGSCAATRCAPGGARARVGPGPGLGLGLGLGLARGLHRRGGAAPCEER